jgi:alkanesulfonate monooxygenase SsuD/methylene tetrahydromethanopterin reductase-like flavin-dependent oxidoreductase (luciferase family)
MAQAIDRTLMLDWARLADDAGFHLLATVDKPNYDSWDPLVTLAAAAAVTERVRLATTLIQLPPRNEVVVAKQAAVIDVLSGGRLDLGILQGEREDDFQAFGADFDGRSERFERQVGRMRCIWRNARDSDRDHGVVGPSPVQKPGPPLWIGAWTRESIDVAARIGDGYFFNQVGAAKMKEGAPGIRELFAANGRSEITVVGLAYAAIGDDAGAVLDEATHHVLRYYGEAPREPADLIHHGPAEKVAEEIAAYADAVDILVVFPQIPSLDQVEQLAEHALPAYV